MTLLVLRRRSFCLFLLSLVCLSGCGFRKFSIRNDVAPAMPLPYVYSISSQTLPPLSAIAANNDGVWTVGDRGIVLASHDNGLTWDQQQVANLDLFTIIVTPKGTLLTAGREGSLFRSSDRGGSWTKINAPTYEDLYGMFSAGNLAWAVGNHGQILRSVDDGLTWHSIRISPNVLVDSIRGSSDGSILFSGSVGGYIFKSTDYGATWIQSYKAHDSIQSLYVSGDGQLIIAVGDHGSIERSQDSGQSWNSTPLPYFGQLADIVQITGTTEFWISAMDGLLLRSTDNGIHWNRISIECNRGLRAITPIRDGRLIVVGWGQTIAVGSRNGEFKVIRGNRYKMNGLLNTRLMGLIAFGQGGIVLDSRNTGTTWSQMSLPKDTELNSAYESPDSVWVAGNHGSLAVTHNGKDWRTIEGLPDVAIHTVTTSENGKIVVAAGDGGLVIRSMDSGTSWQPSIPNTTDDIYSSLIKQDTAYLVGKNGQFLKASIASFQWRHIDTGNHEIFRALVGTNDGKSIWAFGDAGNVYFSHDYGESWQSDDNSVSDDLYAAACLSDCSTIIAVGDHGTIAHHTGISNDDWNYLAKTHFDLRGISFDNNSPFVLASDFTVLHPATVQSEWQSNELGYAWGASASSDGRNLWAVGESGLIWHSTNAGQDWTILTPGFNGSLLGISTDALCLRIFAVGQHGLILSSLDGGASWKQQRIGTEDLYAVRIIGSVVWAVGGVGSIYKMEHDTQRWEKVSMDSRSNLMDIAGDESGRTLWVVGGNGSIFHSTDQGLTWTHQSVGASASLNSVAVLHQDSSSAVAVGDAGTIAITRDGGTRWTISGVTGVSLKTVVQSNETKQLWAAGDKGVLFISDDFGQTWNRITSGTTNWINELVPVRNGQTLYSVGDIGSFMVYSQLTEQYRLNSLSLKHDLGHMQAILKFEGLPTDPLPKFSIRALRTSELNRRNPVELPATIGQRDMKTGDWDILFDLSELNPRAGESFVLQICLNRNSYSRCMPLPTVTVVPWINYDRDKSWLIPLISVLAVVISLTFLLFTWPLVIFSLYRRVTIYEAIEKSSIPGAGLISVLLKGTILPYFALHPRTRRAWIRKRRQTFSQQWEMDAVSLTANPTGAVYVPLPIELAGSVLAAPSAKELLPVVAKQAALQLVGPGGIGKTTLLTQLGRWMLDLNVDRGGCPVIIPLLVGDHSNALSDYLRDKVERVAKETVPLEFIKTMLRHGNMQLFVDGFSEFSPAYQSKLVSEILQLQINSVVLSSRNVISMDPMDWILITPRVLDSNTLLLFITSLLSRLPDDRRHLNTMELQLELGNRIVRLRNTGSDGTPLTPLLVKLYVDRAVDLLFHGQSIDELPKTIAEAYVDFVLLLLRGSDLTETVTALDSLKALSLLSLGQRFVPGRFEWRQATSILGSISNKPAASVLNSFVSAGFLSLERIGLDVTLQFVLDPVAEYCAAYAHTQRCAFDVKLWHQLAGNLDEVGDASVGFRIVLNSVVTSYASKGLCTGEALAILGNVR